MSASIQKQTQSLGSPKNEISTILLPYLVLLIALFSLIFVMFGWDAAFASA